MATREPEMRRLPRGTIETSSPLVRPARVIRWDGASAQGSRRASDDSPHEVG
jgi:hypothetical protein